MIGKHKQTGELVEIYRVWNDKYQDVDKHSYLKSDLEFEDMSHKCESIAWVARNMDGFIYAFEAEPEYIPQVESFSDGSTGIYLGYYETLSDVKAGEKRKVKMQISL